MISVFRISWKIFYVVHHKKKERLLNLVYFVHDSELLKYHWVSEDTEQKKNSIKVFGGILCYGSPGKG